MVVDEDLVLHIASLANLRLDTSEVAHYKLQLAKILKHVAQLSEIDAQTGATAAEAFATPERPDEAQSSLGIDRVLREAPQKVGTAFRVPRVLE